MGETPVTRLTRGSKALAINVPISAALPRFEAPILTATRVGALRRSRAAGGFEDQNDPTAAILHRFAYTFGIEGKVSTQRLYVV